jgi:hypothetical protein
MTQISMKIDITSYIRKFLGVEFDELESSVNEKNTAKTFAALRRLKASTRNKPQFIKDFVSDLEKIAMNYGYQPQT